MRTDSLEVFSKVFAECVSILYGLNLQSVVNLLIKHIDKLTGNILWAVTCKFGVIRIHSDCKATVAMVYRSQKLDVYCVNPIWNSGTDNNWRQNGNIYPAFFHPAIPKQISHRNFIRVITPKWNWNKYCISLYGLSYGYGRS